MKKFLSLKQSIISCKNEPTLIQTYLDTIRSSCYKLAAPTVEVPSLQTQLQQQRKPDVVCGRVGGDCGSRGAALGARGHEFGYQNRDEHVYRHGNMVDSISMSCNNSNPHNITASFATNNRTNLDCVANQDVRDIKFSNFDMAVSEQFHGNNNYSRRQNQSNSNESRQILKFLSVKNSQQRIPQNHKAYNQKNPLPQNFCPQVHPITVPHHTQSDKSIHNNSLMIANGNTDKNDGKMQKKIQQIFQTLSQQCRSFSSRCQTEREDFRDHAIVEKEIVKVILDNLDILAKNQQYRNSIEVIKNIITNLAPSKPQATTINLNPSISDKIIIDNHSQVKINNMGFIMQSPVIEEMESQANSHFKSCMQFDGQKAKEEKQFKHKLCYQNNDQEKSMNSMNSMNSVDSSNLDKTNIMNSSPIKMASHEQSYPYISQKSSCSSNNGHQNQNLNINHGQLCQPSKIKFKVLKNISSEQNRNKKKVQGADSIFIQDQHYHAPIHQTPRYPIQDIIYPQSYNQSSPSGHHNNSMQQDQNWHQEPNSSYNNLYRIEEQEELDYRSSSLDSVGVTEETIQFKKIIYMLDSGSTNKKDCVGLAVGVQARGDKSEGMSKDKLMNMPYNSVKSLFSNPSPSPSPSPSGSMCLLQKQVQFQNQKDKTRMKTQMSDVGYFCGKQKMSMQQKYDSRDEYQSEQNQEEFQFQLFKNYHQNQCPKQKQQKDKTKNIQLKKSWQKPQNNIQKAKQSHKKSLNTSLPIFPINKQPNQNLNYDTNQTSKNSNQYSYQHQSHEGNMERCSYDHSRPRAFKTQFLKTKKTGKFSVSSANGNGGIFPEGSVTIPARCKSGANFISLKDIDIAQSQTMKLKQNYNSQTRLPISRPQPPAIQNRVKQEQKKVQAKNKQNRGKTNKGIACKKSVQESMLSRLDKIDKSDKSKQLKDIVSMLNNKYNRTVKLGKI